MLSLCGMAGGWNPLDTPLTSSPVFDAVAAGTISPATGVFLFDAAVEVLVLVSLDLALPLTGPLAQEAGWGLTALAAPLAGGLPGAWVLGGQLALAQGRVGLAVATAVGLLESLDPFLVVGELALAAVLLGGGLALVGQAGGNAPGYADIVSFCQVRSISLAETFALLTFALGFILFDAFVTLAEDDVLEGVSYAFVGVIGLAVALLALAVDLQYYYMISSISGGELTLRVLYADLVNNALCLLRIFFCWVRYLFYDLQAELVDLSFHYTELAEEGVLGATAGVATSVGGALGWGGLAALTGGLLTTYLDGVALLLQLLIGAFKLALALFLFWLILDLFLLRTLARAEASWGGRPSRR